MIKICGTTSIHQAQIAARAGADYIGIIVNHPASPRAVTPATAREIARARVLPFVVVSVNQNRADLLQIAEELNPRALQLHGDETPTLVRELAREIEIWKVISGDALALREQAHRYRDAGATALIVDARAESASGTIYGGTGQVVDWEAAKTLVDEGFRVILAGGLTPENVTRALEIVRPWGVDVVSGVEANKGVKDEVKVREFVENARNWMDARDTETTPPPRFSGVRPT